MTDDIESILAHNNWTSVNITNTNLSETLLTIPIAPGIYNIYTNATKEVLREIEIRNDVKHYNFSRKINASDLLPNKFKIMQKENNPYIVYNGHQANLRQRATEHFRGSQGTACLAIFELETLRDHIWTFEYLNLNAITNYIDSKLLRTYIEQIHRTKTGWPILCSQ